MNLNITNNFLTTKGAHGIAICGMLSGSISGNKNFNKTSALADNMIELYPLRIGGGASIWINSFSSASIQKGYDYADIAGVNKAASDFRRLQKKRGIYYENFDLDSFYEKLKDKAFYKLVKNRLSPDYPSIMTALLREGKAGGAGPNGQPITVADDVIPSN